MAGYELTHDEDRGFIRCRIVGDISDADAENLAIELLDTIAQARRRSPALRLLWDNQKGASLSEATPQALIDHLRSVVEPGDRVAILVPSSLLKVRARMRASEGNEIFISESAAMTWLNAWS